MRKIPGRWGAALLMLTLALAVGLSRAQTANPSSAPASAGAPAKHKSPPWWGESATPGWSMMTWKERNAHRRHMRSLKTQGECKAYLEQHHAQMAERARAQGKEPLGQPQRDPCASLPP